MNSLRVRVLADWGDGEHKGTKLKKKQAIE